MRSQDIRNKLIAEVSSRLGIGADVVEAVIKHQFYTAYEKTSEVNSIEISGLGKLIFNKNRARRKIEFLKSRISEILSSPETSEEDLKLVDYMKKTIEENEKRIT